MDQNRSAKEKVLLYCIYGLFALYLVFLLRITLFKQAGLPNLFTAIGASERSLSWIPFASIMDMASTDTSIMRILENVLGNIVIFIPLGLLLPVILRREGRNVVIGGFLLSASIEVTQYIFGLGSTDIDDLIFNTAGTAIGYWLFKVIKGKAKSSFAFLASMAALVMVSGTIAFIVLLVNHTDLVAVLPKKIVVENEELVQDFIETPHDFSGKLVEMKDSRLIVEKSVQSAAEPRQLIEFELTADSRIYICHHKIDYFFNSVSGEHQRYEQIAYSDFISQKAEPYSGSNNNVRIWSTDGETVDSLVVVEWVE
ncbi:VanZ family protein [Paenibacillus senegalensis]|uniref:VanZ family protein n=1 Tax=Paenibacillus senegalensis TaxID=1465766 RepID=UPI000288CA10|nr:VanZ family protein [Paenibacillus senegalensis]